MPRSVRSTHNSSALSSKVWAMVFVCCLTKLTNIQIMESKDCSGVCDGISHLCFEVGSPANMHIDQESSLMKVLREASVDMIDLENVVCRNMGINFIVCAFSRHNAHGLVEAKIKVAQK